MWSCLESYTVAVRTNSSGSIAMGSTDLVLLIPAECFHSDCEQREHPGRFNRYSRDERTEVRIT